jgi:predicted MPP superfamily phosphohydrolase
MDLEEQETEHLDLVDFGFSPELEPPPAAAPAAPDRGPWLQYRVPHGFEWNRYALPIAGLPPELEGFRVVQITDLHLRNFWSDVYDQLIERVRKESPDLILLTGDFVESKRKPLPAVPFVRKLVSGLQARLGCFGILGNHDRHHLAPHLKGLPMTLLDRECRRIEVNGAELELLALPGVDRKELTQALLDSYPPRTFGVPRLVLAHFPDHLRKVAALKPDIYFAGHTHGGQICLPNGFSPVRHDSLPRHLCKGVHRAANTWLVVSRGMGFTNISLRLFCPAEVVEVTLTRG